MQIFFSQSSLSTNNLINVIMTEVVSKKNKNKNQLPALLVYI